LKHVLRAVDVTVRGFFDGPREPFRIPY